MIRNLINSIVAWITSKLSGGKTSATTPQAGSLPPLPVGSIAAVADALTQAGRIAEQQTALRNTPEMQKAALAQQEVTAKDKIENDIATQNLDATRRDLAG